MSLFHAIPGGLKAHLSSSTAPHLFSLEDGEIGPTLDEPQIEIELSPACATPATLAKPEYYGDLTGFPLDPQLGRKARAEEIEYCVDKLKVWEVVDRTLVWSRLNSAPNRGRWVDVNRGSETEPEIRSRYVIQETKRVRLKLATGLKYSVRLFLLSVCA